MPDFRPVVLITGVLLMGLAGAMVFPLLADLVTHSSDWRAFAWSAVVTGAVGAAMAIAGRGRLDSLSIRSAFLVTTISWILLAAFAAMPFRIAGIGLSVADSFFESMSGLTTTGSTVITGLDTKPRGILLWRAILQWIGGVGIVVTAIAILPLLKVGGMQLFRLESSDASEKLLPRATEIASMIGAIYVVMTALCAATYMLLGMPSFDAVAHAMSTVATAGFSTSDGSMGTFMVHGADVAAVFFMLASGIPFGVYMLAVRGDVTAVFRDSQARMFLIVSGCLIFIAAAGLVLGGLYGGGQALRLAAFNVVSVMTGTGFATTDYSAWGPAAQVFFFGLMFVGGCAGSTTCGIKIFRFQVAFAALNDFVSDMTRPHAVSPPTYAGRPLSDEAIYSVLSFFFLFFASFTLLAVAMTFYTTDSLTALSAAATAIGNVGPGLGTTIGPAGTFAPLPDGAKWILAAGMLVGRLEILTVLVLFAPSFWRS